MSRARRRQAHRTRLASLSPWDRWCIVHGKVDALGSRERWLETFTAVKAALMEKIDDPAVSFRGFWLFEPSVPDELRADLRRHGHVLLPEPKRSAYQREYQRLIEARRAWLKQEGYR